MFGKVLIANRGEIACRVIATARRMGIATVAVYSEADARALHVEMADEAWPIGAAAARESYLVGSRILDVARRSGAQAIHPGYGFLSENAAFAMACAESGIVFIGPPASAILAMGSKAAAKRLMEQAGVPLVPGYHGDDQDRALLAREAHRIGYPVLIKAVAGGGGKGMRVVTAAEDFASALDGARGEARASFGDDRVLIERYLTRPRHIEIQVFADSHGNAVSLFERDCSIQRRHQKVLEEAPAPGMDAARRQAMGEAACDAARAVGYVGAGTVEFISEDGAFFFMEMNTRLQVEHPVTELITGLDLVEWQLRVANGEMLPLAQSEIAIGGHAIEARIYAEDPARDFLPSVGVLRHLRQPVPGAHVRVDTGVREGDRITPDYDPMIAKLIVHGGDRSEALQHLRRALDEYEVAGVRTNLGLLRAIAADPAFGAGDFDTGFIGRNPGLLSQGPRLSEDERVLQAAACLHVLGEIVMDARRAAGQTADPESPWALGDGWRMDGGAGYDLHLLQDGAEIVIGAEALADGAWRLALPGGYAVASDTEDGGAVRIDGVVRGLRAVRNLDGIVVFGAGEPAVFALRDCLAPPLQESAVGALVAAPIPGRVARILVSVGDAVLKGAALLVVEAMKMEITLSAPADATIASIRCVAGEMVEEGVQLVTFADWG